MRMPTDQQCEQVPPSIQQAEAQHPVITLLLCRSFKVMSETLLYHLLEANYVQLGT